MKWVFSIIVILLFSRVSFAKEITFTGGQPLNQYSPSIIVPILTEAFKRNGINFKAVHHPSLRSLAYSSTGRLDGELHRVYDFYNVSDGKYPDLIRIETEMQTIWFAVFSTKKIIFNTWDYLKNHKVSYSRGKKILKRLLLQYLPKEQILVANDDIHAFKMLSDGIVDIVVSGSKLGDYLLETHSQFSGITKIKQITPVRMYSYIHKKHKQLATKIADTIEQMKRDGSYAKIVAVVNNSFKFE